MFSENGPAPSTSSTHLPPPGGRPDEAPPRGPAAAPGDRGARLARLGDRIAELSARIQAATYELLVLIREFDEREGWDGCLSCAEWLSWAGLSLGAAREHVRVAHALGELPKLSDAMRRGKVSYSKVRAVTRVATPENEQTLLDVALAGTAAHVERIARAWRRIDRNVEQAEERRRQASRGLRTWVDEDGMVVVRGRLTPEVGAVLRRALEAACDQARRAPEPNGGAEEKAADRSAGAEEEAADASTDASANVEEPTLRQRQADAIGTVAEAALAGGLDRGTAGDRYQVVLHVDAEALAEPRDVPAGTSGGAAAGPEAAAGGDRVPAGTPAAHAAAGGPGDGSPMRTEMPGRAGRARQRRWRRTPGACPGARPTPAAGRQTVLDEAGRHPRLRGYRPAHGLRRGHRQHAPRPRRRDPRRRPPHPDHLAGPAPGAGGPRPAVPVPGLRQPPLRCSLCRCPDYADVRPDPSVVQSICDETIGIIFVR